VKEGNEEEEEEEMMMIGEAEEVVDSIATSSE
jgi:hypothetical protein